MALSGVQYQDLCASGESQPSSSHVAQIQPPPIAQYQQPGSRPSMKRTKYKVILFRLGVTEVILGCICVLSGFATIPIALTFPGYTWYDHEYTYQYHRYSHGFTYSSQGIWCGIFLIVTGILGVKAKRKPSFGMYTKNMTMSIISATLMSFLIVLSSLAAVSQYVMLLRVHRLTSLIALHSLVAVVGFIAFILCIVHSAYCCAGVCCEHRGYVQSVTFTSQPHQIILPPNYHYVPVPVQMHPYPIQSYQVGNMQMSGTQDTRQSQDEVAPLTVVQPPVQHTTPTSMHQSQDTPPRYSAQLAMCPQSPEVLTVVHPHQAILQQNPVDVDPTLPVSVSAQATQLSGDGEQENVNTCDLAV